MPLFAALIALVLAFAAPLRASEADLCHAAADYAARQTGVPPEVMLAIALTETGTKRNGAFDAWPWTVNMEGKGLWFDTLDEALAYVKDRQAEGARSFDLGCFQLNHRWHGAAFDSVEAMFDPRQSALYAARFLSDLYAETGSWEKAAGLYHSRTPDLAAKYAANFSRHLAKAQLRPEALRGDTGGMRLASVAAPTASMRVNDYPLLQRGHRGRMGSLVPLGLLERSDQPAADNGVADASL